MSVRIRKSMVLQSLSLTPLIDVVFLLLIFFLVATRFADEEKRTEMDLPSAEEAQPWVLRPDDLMIDVDNQGRFFVESRQLNLEEIDQVVRRRVSSNPLTQTVVIRADSKVQLQPVVQLIDICERYQADHYIAAD